MAEKFNEFMAEVESDIRNEQLMHLWNRYGKLAIGGITVILLAAGGGMMWKNHQQKQRLVLSQQLIMAHDLLEKDQTDRALQQLEDISTSRQKGYATLAKLSEAHAIANTPSKDIEKAKNILASVAADTSVSVVYRDYATLTLVRLTLDRLSEISEEEAAPLLKQLDPLVSGNGAWQLLAMEMKGLILYKQSKFSEATDVFVNIVQHTKTPEALRMRSQMMIQSLASQEKK